MPLTDPHVADAKRYKRMPYRRSGRSGLDLPAVSLGLWQNFGGVDSFENGRAIVRRAFDRGVTHFDLANNYGPPYGSAEENFGTILAKDFRPYRDELVISTKAGYDMWPGPYGIWGSRKYLTASLDQSLKRMGLDYVDIFYSHRLDPNTPLEETMGALDRAVRAGKALYVGHFLLLARRDAQGGRYPARARHAALDPPALLFAAQPLDRTGPARRAGGSRRRLHRLLAARPGAAHRQVFEGRSRRQPRHQGRLAAARAHEGSQHRARPGARQDRPQARPVAGADGHRLGAARSCGSPRPWSARARSSSSTIRSRPCRTSNSARRNWPRSTNTPSMPASTCGRTRRTPWRCEQRPAAHANDCARDLISLRISSASACVAGL